MSFSFNFQTKWLRPVPSLFLWLISWVCSYHLSLNLLDVNPVYVSASLLSPLVTVAWYTTPSTWQAPPTGHVGTPPLQLHPGVGCCSSPWLAIWLLCLLIAWPILGMQQYPIFTVFLLMIFAKGWNGGKQESINFRNLAPTLVLTFKEKGGWKYVIFLEFRFLPPFVFWGGQNLSWWS